MRRVFVAVLLVLAGCSAQTVEPTVMRVVNSPEPTAHAEVNVVLPTPTLRPAPPTQTHTFRLIPAPLMDSVRTPAPAPIPRIVSGLGAFSALGSWIDVFDYDDGEHPLVPLVRSMAARGVRTLYLETSRYTAPADIQFPRSLGEGLDEAKANGMRVIAWYPPGLADVGHDLRRSLAAIRFRSPAGNRFDGFGADIEYTEAVKDHAERSRRAVDYSNQLRAAVGASYPMGAIVIPPTFLDHRPDRWPNFPWTSLASDYQLFMPMDYWTAFGKDAKTAADQTRENTERVRALTGKPVHIIGGLGEDADPSQVASYVKAALEAGSIGGGLYDFTTTRSDVWCDLLKLNG